MAFSLLRSYVIRANFTLLLADLGILASIAKGHPRKFPLPRIPWMRAHSESQRNLCCPVITLGNPANAPSLNSSMNFTLLFA
jgi:hypothetical protein